MLSLLFNICQAERFFFLNLVHRWKANSPDWSQSHRGSSDEPVFSHLPFRRLLKGGERHKGRGWSRNLSTALKALRPPFHVKSPPPRHRWCGSRRLRTPLTHELLSVQPVSLKGDSNHRLASPTFLGEQEAIAVRARYVTRWITSPGYSLEALRRFGLAVPAMESYNCILY